MIAQFEYHEPATLDAAFELLERYGDEAHVLAGGTSLVLLMRLGLVLPGHLVSMRRIEGLREIGIAPDGGLEIGALVTHAEIERSALVQRFFPALAETFGHVATIRVRNQGTIGGNIVHADPAGDPPPMLIALDAEVLIAGRGRKRTVPIAEFFRDLFETALEPGEIVTAVRIPALQHGTVGKYVKFLPGSKDDYATVSVATALRLDASGVCRHARIALGSVGQTPIRARRAESVLTGKKLTKAAVAKAAALVSEEIEPQNDARGSADYKREMARVWTQRSLRELIAS